MPDIASMVANIKASITDSSSDKKMAKKIADSEDERKEKLLNDESPFAMQEAYKTIRTNLQFALSTSNNKCIVVSSALPSEGKSTTCVNLALTMAQTGANVLIIDADMRKPSTHKILSLKNKVGLSSVVGGFCKVGEGIRYDVHSNLDVMTAGPTPPNPSELLGSDNMNKLITGMSEVYDYIFIDTPPINIVSDALIVAQQAAGIVLVARSHQTTHDELSRAISSVEFANKKILGIVVNGVRSESGGYYKYKYKDYRSYK